MAAERQDDPSAAAPPHGRPCPVCGKPSSPDLRPFCSKRCADIDLHRWLGGVYAVPDDEAPKDGAGDGDSGDA